MTDSLPLEVVPLSDHVIQDVINLHLSGMGYTLNSRLGKSHLHFLYKSMAQDPQCFVGVAMVGTRLAGVISGTTDADHFTAALYRRMPGPVMANALMRVMIRPWLLWTWLKGLIIGAPIQLGRSRVTAVLTAIIVDPQTQGRGVGRLLVRAFESFLRQQGVQTYRLDTQLRNTSAIRFYRALGFREMGRRADSMVFVRQIP